nr:hypothetical protein [Herbidospora cretacea]
MHERAGNHHTLHLAAGKEIDSGFRPVGEAHSLKNGIGPPIPFRTRHTVICGMKKEILPDVESPVEIHSLGDDSENALGARGIAHYVDPIDRDLA